MSSSQSPPSCAPNELVPAIEAMKRKSTLQLLFRAARLINEYALESAPRPAAARRLGPAHLGLFAHIPWEGAHVGAIAAKMGVTKQAVSQLLDDLEAAQLVTRRPDPEDGRARLVTFTEQGKAQILLGLEHLERVTDELEQELGSGAVTRLRPGLAKLVTWLEERKERAED